MTKKHGVKKKVSIKLMPGEAVFVSDVETLQHIATTYSYNASVCEDKSEADAWMNVSLEIERWISETYYSGQENDFEEEW